MDIQLVWFERLYDSYADALFRHLYARLGDRERAKELVQEVFMKTWQYVIGGNTITHERAFLYRIAHNLFINEIRTNKHTTSLDTLEEAGYETPDEKTEMPDRASEHRELLDHLAQIPESYRAVLVMRYMDNLPVKEIAHILEEHETAISMRIARSLSALKKTYDNPSL